MELAWLRGVFPPIATPFTAKGAVDSPNLPFFTHLRNGGVDGVVALGSNGEAAQLSDTERIRWVAAVRAALPSPLHLIAGTGADSTRATIERTIAVAAEGAEVALVLAPMYYRRDMTCEALRAHYHAVAEASPIPILIYNVPVYMGWDIPDAWIVAAAAHPNVHGLKDSSGRTERLPGLRAALGPNAVVLAGVGEKMVDAMASGADGAIAALANVAPAACATIRHEMMARRVDAARAVQRMVAPVGEALGKAPGVARLKAALRLQGFDHGDPRLPVPSLDASELARLHDLLDAARLLPSTPPA